MKKNKISNFKREKQNSNLASWTGATKCPQHYHPWSQGPHHALACLNVIKNNYSIFNEIQHLFLAVKSFEMTKNWHLHSFKAKDFFNTAGRKKWRSRYYMLSLFFFFFLNLCLGTSDPLTWFTSKQQAASTFQPP